MKGLFVPLLVTAVLLGTTATSIQATDILVPSVHDEIYEALQYARPDTDRVVVTKATNYDYAPFTMKSGVPVLAAAGPAPIVDAGAANYAVQFANTDQSSVLRGFTIRGGALAVVNMGGAGKMVGCTILSDGDATDYGINHGGSAAVIDSCTVILDNTGVTSVGISLINSNAVVTNTTVEIRNGTANDWGIYMAYDYVGTPLVEKCFVTAPEGSGIYLEDGYVYETTVDGTTGYGIECVGNGLAHNCIITNASGGYEAGGEGSNFDYCIAYPGGFEYPAGGTGNSVDDPLYCDLSGNAYTLRVDSYGNPENNATGDPIGAFPVACLYGTLQRDSEYAGDGILEFPGDLTVPSGRKLILGAGTTLEIAKTDSLESGTSSSDVELIVEGRLEVKGTSDSPVVFDSEGTTHAEADWYGVRCGSTSKAFLDHVSVKHAYIGISMGTADSARVRHAVLSDNQAYDISVGPNSYDYALVDSCEITIGSGTGIHLSGTGATIAYNTLTGNSSSSYGIATYLANSVSTLTGNSITGLANGQALYLASGAPVVTKNTLTDSKYGIYTTVGSYTIGAAADTANHNTITGHTTAGILADGASATPAILTNNISSNSIGVTIKSGANPNLGDANQDGNNKFLSNSTYCIWNRNPSGTISARGNYFGECDGGVPPVCSYGSVDFTNGLCTAPFSLSGVHAGMGLMPPARAFALRAAPNPTGGRTTLHFEIDGPAEVEVQVFDVAGRLVRRFGRAEYGPGEHAVFWDGATSAGPPAPAGIYFFRVIANDRLTRTARVLVVR